MKLKFKTKLVLLVILIIGGFFRLYNLNWDSGHYLHPDERAMVMAVAKLAWPLSVSQFFSPQSTWNPNFFAYGSFPFYLLKIAGDLAVNINVIFAQFQSLFVLGRFISAVTDIATIFILFLLGRKLFSTFVGLMTSFFYAISVLPIQLAHYFAVDSFLTFFVVAVLYVSILFYEKPSVKGAIVVGALFAFALATKISAVILVVSIAFALFMDFFAILLRNPKKPKLWLHHLPALIKHLMSYGFIIFGTSIIFYFILEPYAFIDFNNFWTQTQQQAAMTKDAFTFPYTLQYVGIIPYFYEAKNVFLFGLGPLLGGLSFIGAFYFIFNSVIKEKKDRWGRELLISVFFLSYFFVVGRFAVGWVRYMLPLYPLLALFSAYLVDRLIRYFQLTGKTKIVIMVYVVVLLMVWPLSFFHIYTQPNTRVAATSWILNNIQPGQTMAIEHWDDPLPLEGGEKFKILTLPLYDADTPEKWVGISAQLQQTDYIVIASNRLYVPLQKLTDCVHLPPGHCYTRTAEYYRMLFSGSLGFIKVAEFTSYPTIPLLNIPINDQGADESFTVIDHPKVMIFKKIGI